MASPARGAQGARPPCGGVRRCREMLLAFGDQQGDGLRCASQAAPGNDINAGSPGSQKAPTRSAASPGAIRPGSDPDRGSQVRNGLAAGGGTIRTLDPPSTVSSLHAGARDTSVTQWKPFKVATLASFG